MECVKTDTRPFETPQIDWLFLVLEKVKHAVMGKPKTFRGGAPIGVTAAFKIYIKQLIEDFREGDLEGAWPPHGSLDV